MGIEVADMNIWISFWASVKHILGKSHL